MPKYVIAGEKQLKELPVTLSIVKDDDGVAYVVAKREDVGEWNLFALELDGKFTSCGMLPQQLGFDTDIEGYPVVGRYKDK